MPDELARERRIGLRESLPKLLYQGLHGEVLSAEEAERFLQEPSQRMPILQDFP
jgi:hypothetical protein